MQFLLMCCIEEQKWEALTGAQRSKIMDDYGSFVAGIKKSGHYVGGSKLDHSANAVTVRERSGLSSVTDGPFAETKEQLGGYHLVECKDREEAIALAKRIPTLPYGGAVEVRALMPA